MPAVTGGTWELVQGKKTTLLGQLASGLAHEMGTPLNVITGNAQ